MIFSLTSSSSDIQDETMAAGSRFRKIAPSVIDKITTDFDKAVRAPSHVVVGVPV